MVHYMWRATPQECIMAKKTTARPYVEQLTTNLKSVSYTHLTLPTKRIV